MAQNTEDVRKNRQRGFVFQRSYDYDIHDADGNVVRDISPEEWVKEVTDQWEEVFEDAEHGAYIVHDKDILPKTGDPKPVHIHGVLKFKNARYVGSTMEALGLSRVENCQRPKAYAGAYRYLTHITEDAIQDQKHIYSVDEVKVFGKKSYIELIQRASSPKADEKAEALEYVEECHALIQEGEMMAIDVLEGLRERFSISVAQATWRSHQRYLEGDEDTYVDLVAKKAKGHRNLTTYMIMGQSGSGKTTIARAMAERLGGRRGYHIVSAEGRTTFDMVSTYRGEKVSVLDEVEGSSFNFRQFLSVFDPYHQPSVSSRNKDKAWLAEHAFFTYAEGFEEWIYGMLAYSKGGSERLDIQDEDEKRHDLNHDKKTESEYRQIVRRFKYVMDIKPIKDTNEYEIYVYQFKNFRHVQIGRMKFDKSKLIEDIDWIVEQINSIISSPEELEHVKYADKYLEHLKHS